MNKTQAIELLSEGFRVVIPDVARAICKALDVPFDEQLIDSNYSMYDLIPTRGGQHQGVDTLVLSYYMLEQLRLEVPARANYSRTIQAQANRKKIEEGLE